MSLKNGTKNQKYRSARSYEELTFGSMTDSFPSSAAFDAIAAALSNDADKQDAIKKANSLFCFKLTNSAKEQDSWYIDLKKTGAVGKGEAPEGSKPDSTCSFLLSFVI